VLNLRGSDRLSKNNLGFSLVELMVVVAIIGILTTIALPRYQAMRARALRAQAVASMKNIVTLQHAFYSEHSVFTSDLEAVGFHTPPNSKYTYFIGGIAQTHFIVRARSLVQTCPSGGSVDDLAMNADGSFEDRGTGLEGCL